MNSKEILLILASIAIPIGLADLTLKGLQLPKNSARTMMLSGSSLQTDNQGYRRYEGHRNLEQSAVYGSTIAYRYSYSSNNQGLISTPDIHPGESVNLAISGDSYSEGQGGFAWIKDLQRQWLQTLGVRSINYAIAGSGFGDFAVTATAAKRTHNAQKAMVLFIEHDAYRPYQRLASNAHCSFYSNGNLDKLLGPLTCSLYGVVWHHVPSGLSDQQLIRASLARQQYGVLPALNQLIQQLAQRVQRPTAQIAGGDTPLPQTQLRFGPLPQASLDAIAQIKGLYGSENLLMVQLPDQPASPSLTTQGPEHEVFTTQLEQATGVSIVNLSQSCPLQTSDFHKLDNHPNSRGYQKLGRCLAQDARIKNFVTRR